MKKRNLVFAFATALLTSLVSNTGFSQLEGTWVMPCQTLDMTMSEHVTMQITANNSYVQRRFRYEAPGCQSSDLIYAVSIVGSINLAGESPTIAGAYNANWTVNTLGLMPGTPAMATHWNSLSYCGLSNWTFNQTKNITSMTCQDSNIPVAGTVDFDVLKITGDELRLGFGEFIGDTFYLGLNEETRALRLSQDFFERSRDTKMSLPSFQDDRSMAQPITRQRALAPGQVVYPVQRGGTPLRSEFGHGKPIFGLLKYGERCELTQIKGTLCLCDVQEGEHAGKKAWIQCTTISTYKGLTAGSGPNARVAAIGPAIGPRFSGEQSSSGRN